MGTTALALDGVSLEEDAAVGSLLDDRYLLEAVVGRGGMGVVYRARELVSGEQVAVKVLAEEFAGVPSVRARAVREGMILTRISHPNVVKLRRFGWTAEGLPYIAMEHLVGRPLCDVVAENGPLPFRRILDLARQVAHGVAAAHHFAVLHRDVKPQNVMLSPDPERLGAEVAKVIDFGVAALVAAPDAPAPRDLTAPGVIVGSPSYMSPEQLFGDEVDARTDVYGVGATLFEMITGEPPMASERVTEVFRRKAVEPTPRTIDVGYRLPCPPELEAIVARCLDRDPEQRYRSAAELADVLDALVVAPSHDRPRAAARIAGTPGGRPDPQTSAPLTAARWWAGRAAPRHVPPRAATADAPLVPRPRRLRAALTPRDSLALFGPPEPA